jgi:hypothetical protein
MNPLALIRRKRNPLPLAKIAAGFAFVGVLLVAPVVVGAVAGSLLGYGWRRGAAMGAVFAAVAGGVRAMLGSIGGKAPEAPEPPQTEATP